MKQIISLATVAAFLSIPACSYEPVCGGLTTNISMGDYHYVRRPISRLGPVYQLGPTALIVEVDKDGKMEDITAPPLKARITSSRKVTLAEWSEVAVLHGTFESPYAIHRESLEDFRRALEAALDAEYNSRRMGGFHPASSDVRAILHNAVVKAAGKMDPDGDHVIAPGDKKLVLSRLKPPYVEK